MVGVVYFIIERGFKVELPWRTTRIVFMWACLFAAVFLAWQEQYTRVAQLDRELRQEQEKKHTLERELDKANTQLTQLERELTQAKQAPPLPPDYITLHRPWLNSVFVVSDFRDESFRLSYEIVNIGKLPAERMRLMFASPYMSEVENLPPWPRFIAPGASITHEPNFPLRFKTQHLQPFNSFVLAVEYHATVAGTKRSFLFESEVYLTKEEIKEGRFKPSAVSNTEGRFTSQAMKTFLGTPFAR